MAPKITWKIFLLSCIKAKSLPTESRRKVLKQDSVQRLSLADISDPGSLLSASDLSNSVIASNLHIFTLAELKEITHDFSSSNFLGEGGFGPVHKGFVDDKCRPGMEAQPVAVKLLDLDGTQGHREWMTEVVLLGQLRHPHLVKLIGYCCEDEHRLLVYEYMARGNVSTRVMGTHGYAAPEYVMTGHLTTMSDVYGFGVVLLELLTGKRAMDKNRPAREQNLVKWARPLLKNPHKLGRIMDPRLECQYSIEGAKKVAALAFQCLSYNPKSRPTMNKAVKILELVLELNDIPVGSFVYIAPTECKLKEGDPKEAQHEEINEGKLQRNEYEINQEKEEKKKEKGNNQRRKGYRHMHRLRCRAVYSDTALYKTIRNEMKTPISRRY